MRFALENPPSKGRRETPSSPPHGKDFLPEGASFFRGKNGREGLELWGECPGRGCKGLRGTSGPAQRGEAEYGGL